VHGVDFREPNRRHRGVQLTVEIGLGDMVKVDQRQMTNPTARQCFSRPGSNSTETNDHDMGAP
jgi:hypothetical protein